MSLDNFRECHSALLFALIWNTVTDLRSLSAIFSYRIKFYNLMPTLLQKSLDQHCVV